MIEIRPATSDDLHAINQIYNHYVPCSTCTYQEDLETMPERVAWFANRGERHPVTVALLDDVVVGWGSLSPFRQRAAYRNSVENSVYVAHTHQRRGIGKLLLADLIERARMSQHRTIIAAIDAEQAGSVALHVAFGFVPVAFLREVGYKFDRWLNVQYLQLMLDEQRSR